MLAASYVIAQTKRGMSASARCAQNGRAALAVGRVGLWRLWMMAACALSACEQVGGLQLLYCSC